MTNVQAAAGVPEWTLGDRMGKARRSAGLSKSGIAEGFGIHVNSITNYEMDRTSPRKTVLMAWALRCGVPFAWLATGDTGPIQPTDHPSDLPGDASPWKRRQARLVPAGRAA